MTTKNDLSWLVQRSQINHRDVPLIRITLNKDAIAVLCAEDLMDILAKDTVNFDEAIGIDHAFLLIEEVLGKAQQEQERNVTFDTIKTYVDTMTRHILKQLPDRVNGLIDELMTDGMIKCGITLQPRRLQLSRAVREILTSRVEREKIELFKTVGLKENERGGSEPKFDLSQLARYFEITYPILQDAKSIYRQNRNRKEWRGMVRAAHPDLETDLLERLANNPILTDELAEKLAQKGGTSAASDIALEYAARLCGLPPYQYTLRHLKEELRRQGMSARKVKAKGSH